jgi:hypothetical protein
MGWFFMKNKIILTIMFVFLILILGGIVFALPINVELNFPDDEDIVPNNLFGSQMVFHYIVNGAFPIYNCTIYINNNLFNSSENIINNIPSNFTIDISSYNYILEWKIGCNATFDFGGGPIFNSTNSTTRTLYENRNITECGLEITKSGEYNLTQNVDATAPGCIRITTNNVTLNLNGFNITASDNNATAIYVENTENITINGFNSVISGFNNNVPQDDGKGIYLSNVVNVSINNISLSNNHLGVFLSNSTDVIINNSIFSSNEFAILSWTNSNIINNETILDDNTFTDNEINYIEQINDAPELYKILMDFEVVGSSVSFEIYSENVSLDAGEALNVTVIQDDWEITAGNNSVFIPQDTVIIGTNGSNMNILLLDVLEDVMNDLSNITNVFGAMQFGIPNFGLNFSKNITINLSVEIIDDFNLSIYKSLNGENWTQNGLTNTSCIVENGNCVFNTTQASYFATNNSIEFCGGGGTTNNPFLICNATQLNATRNYLSAHYKLNNSIDLDVAPYNESEGWVPIETYTGTFDGDGHIISNLFINRSGSDFQGLFEATSITAEIKNIGLTNVNVTGKNKVGGLVGQSRGYINNSYVTGIIQGTDEVGGLVGDNYDGTINNSYVTGFVEGNQKIGGLTGYNFRAIVENSHAEVDVIGLGSIGGLVGLSQNSVSKIINSYATGNVNATANNAGGLVGYNDGGDINNSYATGTVEGDDNIGGLVGGSANSPKIVNSYATGNVKGDDYIGGLVGRLTINSEILYSYATGTVDGGYAVGGLVGYNLGIIEFCYATGAITNLVDDYIGGLVGYNDGEIHNSYATGAVTGNETESDYVGGFVGENVCGGNITNSYSTGLVTGGDAESTAGFVGNNDGTIEKSYFNTQTSQKNQGIGDGNPGDVVGKTTSQMKTLSTFIDWNITTTTTNKNNGYPYLAWQNDVDSHVWLIYYIAPVEDDEDEEETQNRNLNDFRYYTSKTDNEPLDVDDNDLNNGFKKSLKKNNKLKFNLIHSSNNNKLEHTLELNNFNSTHAIFTLRSEPIEITAKINEDIFVDIDNDEINDLLIRYEGIKNEQAEIFVQQIIKKEEEKIDDSITQEQEETIIEDKQETIKTETISEEKHEEEEKNNNFFVRFILLTIIAIGIVSFFIIKNKK